MNLHLGAEVQLPLSVSTLVLGPLATDRPNDGVLKRHKDHDYLVCCTVFCDKFTASHVGVDCLNIVKAG